MLSVAEKSFYRYFNGVLESITWKIINNVDDSSTWGRMFSFRPISTIFFILSDAAMDV